jgi:hypothetical protein
MKKLAFYLQLLFLILLTLSHSYMAEARFIKPKDAQVKYNFYNAHTKVNKDGTFESTIEFEVEILKEGGRGNFTNYRQTYNEDIHKFEILEAKTIFEGKTYKVPKKNIESKPLASSKEGFDQQRQVSVPFSKVEIGTKVYLKLKYIAQHVPIENHFDEIVFMGSGSGYTEKKKITIESEIPLYYKKNDPREILNIKTTKACSSTKNNATFSKIEITLKRAFSDHTVNETSRSELSEKNTTWVAVSTTNKWEDIVAAEVKGYSDVTAQKLPKMFQQIAEEAKKQNNEVDQINKVTSLLNKKIQYLGDWKTIKGRFVPRDLNTIANTQYGDCKDFTASTIAILKSMNYQAFPLLVYRGNVLDSYNEVLPGVSTTNHVMVKATSPSGKIYWVDPTNLVSMADDIFADVSNRKGLLLDEKNPQYLTIPESDYNKSNITYNRTLTFDKNYIEVEANVAFSGREVIPFIEYSLFYSKEQFIDALYYQVERSHIEPEDRIKTEVSQINDRDVKDFCFKLKYKKKADYVLTNYGNGIELAYGFLPNMIGIPNDSKHDIYTGNVKTFSRTTILKNKEIVNISRLNTSIETPWMVLSRKAKVNNGNTEIIDKLIVLKSTIKNEELQGQDFQKLKNHMRLHYNNCVIVLEAH